MPRPTGCGWPGGVCVWPVVARRNGISSPKQTDAHKHTRFPNRATPITPNAYIWQYFVLRLQPSSQSTPIKPKFAVFQLGLFVPGLKDLRKLFDWDMQAMWIGLLSTADFMNRFMGNTPASIPTAKFRRIEGLPENDMYTPFFVDVLTAKLCTNLPVYVTAHARKTATQLRPDGTCDERRVRTTSEEVPVDAELVSGPQTRSMTGVRVKKVYPVHMPFDWHSHGLIIEFKSKTKDDPFYLYEEAKALGQHEKVQKTDDDSLQTLGQLAHYAAEIFNHQHRTYAFQLLICGCSARFIYWDRAGAVVSERFDFHAQPQILAEFFTRYQRMAASERGWDPSVREPKAVEVNAFYTHVQKLLDDMKDPTSGQRPIAGAEQTLDKNYTPYKIVVNAGMIGKRSQELIVQKPIEVTHSPTGRGTRGYIAYSVTEKRVVFLKDSWRVQISGLQGEDTIYSRLEEAKVEGAPTVLCAGDVCTNDDDDNPQTTRAQEIANDQELLHKVQSSVTRTHMHHRVVQELAYSLSTSVNSKEYTLAFRDAFKTLDQAYKSSILHRDISFNNIMLNGEGQVVVNDWDHAGIVREESTAVGSFRTGTWPFMSIGLLQDPFKPHDLLDDFESLYWSEFYGALKYFSGDVNVDLKMFFESDTRQTLHGPRLVGGAKKLAFLKKNEQSTLRFDSEPFRLLLNEFKVIWNSYYRLKARAEGKHSTNETLRQRFEEMRKTMLEAGYWCGIIDRYVEMPGWKDSDTCEDRYPPRSVKEVDMSMRQQLCSAFILAERSSLQQHGVASNNIDRAVAQANDIPAASGELLPDSPLFDPFGLPGHYILGVPLEAGDDPFALDHPSPPLSAPESAASSVHGSAPLSLINVNGKRTLSLHPEDGDDDVGVPSALPAPDAKRSRMEIEDSAESSAQGRRTRTRSLPSAPNGEPRKFVRLSQKGKSSVNQ